MAQLTPAFDTAFAALTGNRPFRWQRRLFDLFSVGSIPTTCEIPTGLGKTSVIAIWLLARATGADLPRRLVYVVNRRTVVDQTTAEVERLRSALGAAGLSEALSISTLRGQFADNREWSEDPSRPAVISGTVDMIGSRLLFSGYRIGFKTRPLHAGFLGQDALVIHDEAHLEPSFQYLLEKILEEQQRCGDPWPLRLMALSATARSQSAVIRGQRFRLEVDEMSHAGENDEQAAEVARRLSATKRLMLYECPDKQLVEHVVEQVKDLADGTRGRTVLVFLRTVEDVTNVVDRLLKAGFDTRQLTGTMRGYERERLATKDPVFRLFLPQGGAAATEDESPREHAVVLVCTSAGEVGVNLSADHLVCDLSTFDSMAQRFGRVNRFGRRESEVRVLHPAEKSLGPAEDGKQSHDEDDPLQSSGDSLDGRRLKTLRLLRNLGGDASPRALSRLDPAECEAAYAPPPKIEQVTEILFDAWAMTTVRRNLPGRPGVATYLHGIEPWEPPVTLVGWRDEVDLLQEAEYGGLAKDLLDDYPIKPFELLRDTSQRVAKTLAAVVKTHRRMADTPVWKVAEDGEVKVMTLSTLAAGDVKHIAAQLADCTLLLPARSSRPINGMLTVESFAEAESRGEEKSRPQEQTSCDVADAWGGELPSGGRRCRIIDGEPPPGMRLIRSILLTSPSDEDEDDAISRRWDWYERPRGADDEGSRSSAKPVLLEVHAADVEARAKTLVERLNLPNWIARAVVAAARYHDRGKNRRLFQRSIGNPDDTRTFAKSGCAMRPLDVTSFRHELGSVIDARRELLGDLSPEERDLALHLIAAHHGRGRPHFPADELFDPDATDIDFGDLGHEVMERFERLQRRLGRWGLAYVESLVRAADYAASAEPSRVEPCSREPGK